MKRRVLYLFNSFICALVLLASPLPVTAEGIPEDTAETLAPVIITEIQTGATTANDEFIELYNQSDEPVNIAGWQIRYLNSTATTTTLLATILPTSGATLMLDPGEYFVLHTPTVAVPTTAVSQSFSAALSKTDKTVGLFARDETVCQMIVQDAAAWEVTPGTTSGEGAGVVVTTTQSSKDKLLQRYRDNTGAYVDTNHNALDFVLTTTYTQASPGTDNMALLPGVASEVGEASSLEPIAAPDCSLPEPDEPPIPIPDPESPPSVEEPPVADPDPARPQIPAENTGLKPPQLSELLPNPASPQTDAKDEFIEFYNPNNAAFNLSGYVLEVGTTTKRRYTFATGTRLPAKTFVAFFSADTRLALSNSNGQVRLLDPLGRILAESDPYTGAKDNQAWLFANGLWQWSVKPTPNAINVVSAPESKKKSSAPAKSAAAVKSSANGSRQTSSEGVEHDDQQTVAALAPQRLHPGILALVGGFAILYGAYEYRHDVANKIRKFRQNRTARRRNRPGADGG